MPVPVDGSCLPYFLVMTVLILTAHLLVRRVPFYRAALVADQAGRYEALDGLRGLLATGVFLHHGVIMYYFHRGTEWQTPPSAFYTALGQFSVALFFMITGFLFWSKAISRNGSIDARTLYWSRVWRLAPLYGFSVFLICLIVAVRSSFQLREPIHVLVEQLLRLGSLGLVGFTELNGVYTLPINAGVTWSLRYEWLFYLALPALAWFARPGRFLVLPAVLLVGYTLIGSREFVHLLNFSVGMATAHLVAAGNPLRPLMARRGWSLAPIAAVLAVGLGVPVYSLMGVMCGAVVFLSVVSGADLWGLLRIPAARLLGMVSYSIYLLHGIVLCVGLDFAHTFIPVQRIAPPLYWLVVTVCGLLLVCLSAVTYRWFEHPFLRVPLPAWHPATRRALPTSPVEVTG